MSQIKPHVNFFPGLLGPSSNNKTRPAEVMQSLVTPTPKKMRSSNDSGYNRKKKSLGLLAETFILRFAESPPGVEIFVDHLAKQLVVERRRIYDVVNILESLRVVVKKGKNAYHWMGTNHLARQFALLQHDAIFEHADVAVEHGLITQKPSPEEIHAAQANQDLKESKSLSRLSQLFLRCYLVGYTSLTLPEASDKINGERTTMEDLAVLGCKNKCDVPTDPKLFQQAAMRGLKTKIRRLYDIANVFMAIGLLKKTDERSMPLEARRPKFTWDFRLSPKQLVSLYDSMPTAMKLARNPFPTTGKAAKKKATPRAVATTSDATHTPRVVVSTCGESSSSATDVETTPSHHHNEPVPVDDALMATINQTGGAEQLEAAGVSRRVSLPESATC